MAQRMEWLLLQEITMASADPNVSPRSVILTMVGEAIVASSIAVSNTGPRAIGNAREGFMPLTGKQRRKLRALGHHLHPVVLVGQQGVTPEVVAATEEQLAAHELIKVKLPEDTDDRTQAAEELASLAGAEVAQVLGRTVLLFKQREEASKIDI